MTTTTNFTKNVSIDLEEVLDYKFQLPLNGKTYEVISLRQKKNGEWIEVDLKMLSHREREALVQSALKTASIFKTVGVSSETPYSLTLHFSKHGLEQLPFLKKIILQEDKTSEKKSVPIDMRNYSETVQQSIREAINPLSSVLKHFTTNYVAPLDGAIHDFGSQDNKCAALAIAGIRIHRKEESGSVIEVAQRLFLSSLNEIENNNEFVNNDVNINAILSSVKEYNIDHPDDQIPINDDDTPETVRANYLAKLRSSPGQMLDLPFFLTLDKPTIILERKGSGFAIKAIAKDLDFQKVHNLSLKDLDQVYIVVYENRNHYKAFIPQWQHVPELRKLLTNHQNP